MEDTTNEITTTAPAPAAAPVIDAARLAELRKDMDTMKLATAFLTRIGKGEGTQKDSTSRLGARLIVNAVKQWLKGSVEDAENITPEEWIALGESLEPLTNISGFSQKLTKMGFWISNESAKVAATDYAD